MANNKPYRSFSKHQLLPILLLFLLGQVNLDCNAYQVKKDTLDYWNVQKFVINQKTSQQQLDEMQSRLKKENVSINFSDITRDEQNGYLKGLSISYKSENSNGTYIIDESKPYSPIAIQYDVVGKTVNIGPNPTSNLSQTIQLEPQRVPIPKSSDTLVYSKKSEIDKETTSRTSSIIKLDSIDNKNTFILKKVDTLKIHTEAKDHKVYIDDENRSYVLKRMDGKYLEKDSLTGKIGGNVNWISKKDSLNNVTAIGDGEQIFISGSGGKPLIIKDGVVYEQELNLINSNDIKSINVIKGENAILKYGDAAVNGVIEINTIDKVMGDGLEKFKVDNDSINSPRTPLTFMTLSIKKDADNRELEKQRNYLKKINVTIEYSKIQRDEVQGITRIKITLKDDQGNSASSIFNDSYGIPEIYFGKDKKGLFISATR